MQEVQGLLPPVGMLRGLLNMNDFGMEVHLLKKQLVEFKK
jgi:hypothetical protein